MQAQFCMAIVLSIYVLGQFLALCLTSYRSAQVPAAAKVLLHIQRAIQIDVAATSDSIVGMLYAAARPPRNTNERGGLVAADCGILWQRA